MSSASLLLLLGACAREPVPADPAAAVPSLLSAAGFQAAAGKSVPEDFVLDSLEGASVGLSTLRGKPVLLNFWATWCPPCRAELPSLASLYLKYRGRGLAVLGVDLREDPAAVEAFSRKEGIPFPVLLDRDGAVGSRWGVTGIPTTYLISADGAVMGRIVGAHDWDTPQMAALMESLLGK